MNNQSISTARSTHKHPTLPSHTNYAYPFSKTKRFPDPAPPCPQAFYSYDSQLSTRKAGMGFGKKTDMAAFLPLNTPTPTRYRIGSLFDPHSQGVTFGSSRQKSPDRSYLIPQIHKHPSPASYENQVQTIMPEKYSMRSKTIDILQKTNTANFAPGPGAYQPLDFQNQTGKRSLSKHPDAKYGTIDPNLKRFPQIKNSPGPASYDAQGGEIGNRTILSRHNGPGGRVFGREARFTGQHWRPRNNPGPAAYNIPPAI